MEVRKSYQRSLASLFKKKSVRITLAVIGLLIIIRLILPYIVLHYANKSLASIPGYYGHISDVDLSLYRGAYQIHDFYLNKKDSATSKETEFLKIKNLHLSVEWNALLHGSLVGEIVA